MPGFTPCKPDWRTRATGRHLVSGTPRPKSNEGMGHGRSPDSRVPVSCQPSRSASSGSGGTKLADYSCGGSAGFEALASHQLPFSSPCGEPMTGQSVGAASAGCQEFFPYLVGGGKVKSMGSGLVGGVFGRAVSRLLRNLRNPANFPYKSFAISVASGDSWLRILRSVTTIPG